MWWEILLYLLVLPILEGIGWLIADRIELHVTWKPFKKQYEQAIENSTPDNFVVLVNRDEKSVILVGIICFAIVAVLGIVASLASYFVQNNTGDALTVGLVCEAVTLPAMLVLIHYYSRQIFVAKDALLLKSAVVKKRIDIGSIRSVYEIKVEYRKRLIIRCKRAKITVKDTDLNYEFLKNFFKDRGLLGEDGEEIK